MSIQLKAFDIIEKNTPELIAQSEKLSKLGLTPFLAVILVGNNHASETYVKNKKAFCHKIGAKFELIKLDANISEHLFLDAVKKVNDNPEITGCFVQLPVPSHLSHIDITQLINPIKDVDGFHLDTICDIYRGNLDYILPCTPKGIITLLNEYNIAIEGKNITIIGRSFIVGKPLALILQSLNATVTLCHSKTKNLSTHTKNADIIICATGAANLINESHIHTDQVLIDVGMNKVNGKLTGDIDYNSVSDKVKAITPVPGGVGPMTVFSLMQNLLKTTQNILDQRNNK